MAQVHHIRYGRSLTIEHACLVLGKDLKINSMPLISFVCVLAGLDIANWGPAW